MFDDGMGAPMSASTATFAEIPPQDLGPVLNPQGAQLCVHDHFMRTIRIPLSHFCGEIENLLAVRLTFGLPGTTPPVCIPVDSLELTANPFDVSCP